MTGAVMGLWMRNVIIFRGNLSIEAHFYEYPIIMFIGCLLLASSLISCSPHAQNRIRTTEVKEAKNAAEPKWEIFDPEYSHDFIDTSSFTYPEKGIARFWERAGDKPKKLHGKVFYPMYTLAEINCQSRTLRHLNWDVAVEDQNTPEGIAARAKFLQYLQFQNICPSPWERIKPEKHSYARYDFVCNRPHQE